MTVFECKGVIQRAKEIEKKKQKQNKNWVSRFLKSVAQVVTFIYILGTLCKFSHGQIFVAGNLLDHLSLISLLDCNGQNSGTVTQELDSSK